MANPSHDLLPCPFCGAAARYDDEYDDRGNAVIACNECGANVGANELDPGIERWNRRATPPSPSTAPEADPERDFSDWMERRGALGAGAVPERIFFAGHSAGRRSALASRPAEVDDEGLPAVLFDGHAVYSEITRTLGKTHCHNHETVSATLDAVVRLMRAEPAERAQ